MRAYTANKRDERGRQQKKQKRNKKKRKRLIFPTKTDWNIPKQLARFDWEDLPGGAKQVRVFPYENDDASHLADMTPSPTPLFQASFKTIPYVPAFPLSTQWARYAGLDTTLVQPPVPQGKAKEIVGTDRWCRCVVAQQSSRTHVGWFDLSQRDEEGRFSALFENFWPGMGRWQLGVRMDDAKIEIPEGEFWDGPRASL